MIYKHERKCPWEFTLDDGSKIVAKFTDSEIDIMKTKYPKILWID